MDDLRTLAATLVAPAAAKLSDPDGGREYLQVSAEFYSLPRARRRLPRMGQDDSIARWHKLLDPLVPPEERSVLHTRYPAIRFAFMELARRTAATRRGDDGLFTSHLTDLVAAVLNACTSPATARLLAQRAAAADAAEA